MAIGKSSGSSSIRDRDTGDTAEVGTKTTGEKALQVIAEVPSLVTAGEFTTFKSNTEVVLTSDTVYDTLHSVTGSGFFLGATFVVDNTKVECVIEIDGNMIFDFAGVFLKEVVNTDYDFKASGIFGVSKDGKRLYMTLSEPIKYESSLVFKARKIGKKVKYQLYTYSEI